MMLRQQFVRKIAYAIWENEGRPDGEDLDHWFRAEAVVRDTPTYDGVADLIEAPRHAGRAENLNGCKMSVEWKETHRRLLRKGGAGATRYLAPDSAGSAALRPPDPVFARPPVFAARHIRSSPHPSRQL
jgi:hypothetical protein